MLRALIALTNSVYIIKNHSGGQVVKFIHETFSLYYLSGIEEGSL